MYPKFSLKRGALFALALFFVALVVTLTNASGPLSEGSAPGIVGGLLLLPLIGGFVKHGRNIQDLSWIFTKALPAANASNEFDPVDLESVRPGTTENTEWEIEVPDLPNNIDSSKSVVIKVFTTAASGDSISALVDPIAQLSVPGVATTGSASTSVRFRLPGTAKRYLRVSQAIPTGGGNNTASSTTLRQLF